MAETGRTPRILNCTESQQTENDWTIADALEAGILAAAPIPDSVDLREPWWQIGDQGSTGSCVGWATADSVLRWHFVKAGLMAEAALLSPRFIWMAAKETDEFRDRPTTFIELEGTSLKAALDITKKYGAVLDSVLPFASGALYNGKPNAFYIMAAKLRISSYINLGRESGRWKEWLANNGPILTRLSVDDSWYGAKENNGNLDEYLPNTARGGHAIALVGYTKNRFIVRNSWGKTEWGDAGFGYASIPYAEQAFTEAYGVII